MGSNYLNRLSEPERKRLVGNLWEIQKGKCFITAKDIDLEIHYHEIDVDHVIPSMLGGKDDPSNFALTFSYANRSKQASDLKLARILFRFKEIQDEIAETEDRGANLADIINRFSGSKKTLKFRCENGSIFFSLSKENGSPIIETKVYKDKLSGLEYFFALLPIEYIFHDDKINPRSIGSNISKLITEFYSGNPQLHISLGYIDISENNESPVKVFDGQHKAAAQVLLGVKEMPVRIFINPNEEILTRTNYRAGTELRQVAFDKSVQRLLGSTLYSDRVQRYQEELGLNNDNLNFSEKELVNYFKGESRELRRYIVDAVRDGITRNNENKLMEFVDMGGRAKEKPISYSSIEKTFYSFFIFQDVLETPISHKLEEGKNPRELEKAQIVRLMNIIAEELFLSKFDLEIGTFKIENRIQNDEMLPLEHVRAFRMAKEEILYNWLKLIGQIVQSHFVSQGYIVDERKLFQVEFSEILWTNIRNYIINLAKLPLWSNNSLSATVFGGKQNYQYWLTVFTSGSSPQGFKVLSEPLNLLKLQHP